MRPQDNGLPYRAGTDSVGLSSLHPEASVNPWQSPRGHVEENPPHLTLCSPSHLLHTLACPRRTPGATSARLSLLGVGSCSSILDSSAYFFLLHWDPSETQKGQPSPLSITGFRDDRLGMVFGAPRRCQQPDSPRALWSSSLL